MGNRIYLNDDWTFVDKFSLDFLNNKGDFESVKVSVPHTVSEIPYNYFSEEIYQKVSGYRKLIEVPADWENKSVRLTFEGVAHKCMVYINGEEICSHSCGYTAFEVDITKYAKAGSTIDLVLCVDSRENLNQPPFGFVIDYMTYGGIYRDVYVTVSNRDYIKDAFYYSTFDEGIKLNTELMLCLEEEKNVSIRQFLDEKELKLIPGKKPNTYYAELSDVELWDIDNPKRYCVKTVLEDLSGNVLDCHEEMIGIRKSEFRQDGYYLNGRKLKIRGLNRHQSFAYAGYAMPDSMQIKDADILKYELGVNAVRTSHYPQSHAFIERCDEIGLLVFTEMPGWQHIGDETWKKQAVKNTEDMILQYRNHPSIILWGVRINESQDDDAFYKATNEAAHRLDPSRPTGGVRNFKKSHLFEDVYTYNDFSHNGKTPGCDKKKRVTSHKEKPYLISEYNGHMYPTKAFDDEDHRTEHATRHATVIDAVASENDIAGSFGWCMFDYNTHKDFGSGDRICYHGVTDMFRNPKLAAFVYAAEGISCEEKPVLEISSSMDIGEHPEGCKGKVYIISNADSVRMYKNGRLIHEYFPGDSPYKGLKHGPIFVDDYIGSAIDDNEKYSKAAKRDLKVIANEVSMKGLSHMSLKTMLLALKALTIHGLKYTDAVDIFNKYVGDWGGESTVYTFEAIYKGKVVKTVTKAPGTGVHFEIDTSHTKLIHKKSYDVALVRIKAVDDYGNVATFFNEPISLETEGKIGIIGDKITCFRGGLAGTYVKTLPMEKGEASKALLKIKNSQCGEECVEFTVERSLT